MNKVLPMRQAALVLASLILTLSAPTAVFGQGQQKGTQKPRRSRQEYACRWVSGGNAGGIEGN